MKNAKTIAWGLIISLGVCMLPALFGTSEDMYAVGGIGIWIFGIWAIIVLLKNAPKQKKH